MYLTDINKISVLESEKLHEKLYSFKCRNGLPVYLIPKDFSTSYAIFGTNYGSQTTSFTLGGKKYDIPLGTAHFLEHKMFDCPDGSDAFSKFAAIGAYSNAYTSYDKTAYLFSCTENQYEALKLLLDFVSHPYYTEKTVAKEQGIISQEIKMYEDSPSSRLFQGMLSAMYESCGIRYDIAGTVSSISEITADTLYSCYNAFYTPDNMGLFLCGRFEPEKVMEVCDEIFPEKCDTETAVKCIPEEKSTAISNRFVAEMEVSKPLFCIGVKDTDISEDPYERLKKSVGMEIICEILFSKSSPFFNELYESGLITGDLGYWHDHNKSFSVISISGESDEPEKVFGRFKGYLEKIKSCGVDEESFERCRRVVYSTAVKCFDSTESIANSLLSFVFDGEDLFEYASFAEKISLGYVNELINKLFRDEYCVLSEILPIKDNKEE